ncbi:MAG: hypothetical protein VX944_05890 [Myxococcota bacterium]|nr:hypothetical protein [Myxococcota bacterium]MEC9389589.1 hypothetical protein [Myxococcota bacterium]
MARIARMIQNSKRSESHRFDSTQHFIEDALRTRAARTVRMHVRRMEPLVVRTPRWSNPSGFLEDLALDLAVGQPAVGCRTVNLRPLKGRKASESWQFTLHVFSQLGRRDWRHRAPQMVADRGGFRFALSVLIEEAHQTVPHPVALLAFGAEFAPVEVVEDIAIAWGDYAARHPTERSCTMLLAGTAGPDWWPLGDVSRVDLVDYGEAEAAAAIVGRVGNVPFATLQKAAHFSGGVPGLVEAMSDRIRRSAVVPRADDELLASLGTVVDEIRGAVDIVHMDSALADRLYDLTPGEALPYAAEVDDALTLAGLVRPTKSHGTKKVKLRAPAIGTILG